MAFSIDAAVDVLGIVDRPTLEGHSGIFAFQRDNQLYLVGRKAVAVVSQGIPCSYWIGHHDETLDSYIPRPFEQKGVTTDDSEREYLALLCRNPDGDRNTLTELLQMGKKVHEEFPDDGRIRMVDHGENYHSHKYGYAADGIDVFLADARVMIRSEYFDLMRARELKAKEQLDESGSSLLPAL